MLENTLKKWLIARKFVGMVILYYVSLCSSYFWTQWPPLSSPLFFWLFSSQFKPISAPRKWLSFYCFSKKSIHVYSYFVLSFPLPEYWFSSYKTWKCNFFFFSMGMTWTCGCSVACCNIWLLLYGVDAALFTLLRICSCRTQHGYFCMEKSFEVLPNN